ncbi:MULTISPECIES: dihydrofolate reductase [unclassified Lactococcus]|uniref:dihydrofolate reductase n=1 Tax=unclassified Lactococcus TaxID=2643510 RepID=UPI0011C8721F|nr:MULTISPECIES: dihydrofolate reductase [unclassified Lactococcus]MQW23658.1 dihydrofolate reductase [Lactococcus sp. dk101]TXK37609.1 dihydrofolate reductase [Lactococcus sp. dk310]TXK49047.1 dihydrofolate reductase [Lactococcus sp. dk322]
MILGIWAEAENGVIGKDGKLPWHLPRELQHFKTQTMNQAILMGRKTFEGMNKRVLPGRTSIILTRDKTYMSDNPQVKIMNSQAQVMDWLAGQEKDLYITGGAEMFCLFEAQLDGFYRTLVHHSFDGDTFFPTAFDFSAFEKMSEEKYLHDEKNPFDFTIQKYKRR